VEAGFPNSEFDFWIGSFVPKQTPRAVVARMHAEIVKGLENAVIKDKLAKLGVEPLTMKADDFDARVAREAPIAIELAKAAGIALK
jgi:tripartite-type tricarboxylate transporter receptor subunit TctC